MTLFLSLSPELSFIKADPVRIEQVILNLLINAKDAMKEGGTLSISTENEELKAEDCFENPESKPGKYVVIKISDTDTGINPEIIDRIFEPFFTTKEKGTGLGLSIVYGIVKQAGGSINVESIYGEGTTFKIYLPASEEKIDMLLIQEKESKEILDNLKGRILVIEDDPSVLEFIKDSLEISGFEVITALSGEEGIEKARKFKKEISFLLADVILPNKNRIETAKEIREILPEIKLIFMSGYSLNKISKIFEVKNAEFLQKPLSPSLLIEKIRNSLQRRK
ncbi:MAG: ATP-binding protein [Candidatus Aminicenantia bacterium]